tara:strand:- start:401 stop:568 length:168 start_codon:yes stop_codon:yes gene_type:complete
MSKFGKQNNNAGVFTPLKRPAISESKVATGEKVVGKRFFVGENTKPSVDEACDIS